MSSGPIDSVTSKEEELPRELLAPPITCSSILRRAEYRYLIQGKMDEIYSNSDHDEIKRILEKVYGNKTE